MRARHIIFTFSATVIGLSSCMKEAPGVDDSVAVRFGANVAAPQATRVLNDQWQAGDQIGVFMMTADGTVEADIKEGAFNRRYVYNDGFTAVDADIYYPKDGTEQLDFAAIYPWRDGISGSQYAVNVSDQTDPAALEVMYARTNGIPSPSNETVKLTFYHKLSILSIRVLIDDGIDVDDLTDMTAIIGGVPTAGTLDLNTGTITPTGNPGSIAMLKGSEAGTIYDAVFDAIVIPSEGISGRNVTFTIDDTEYTWVIPENVILSEGLRHTYTINISGSGVEFIGVTITPWDEVVVVDGGFAIPFEIQLSGRGLEADLNASFPNAVNTEELRVTGGQLTAADFEFMRDRMPNLAKLDMRNATVVGDRIPDKAFYKGDPVWKGKNTLRNIILPEGVATIGESAFQSCHGLESVFIPGNIKVIAESAFMDCIVLTTVTISEGVEKIGDRSFYGCSTLQSIIIPQSVTTISEYAFTQCKALESITIPEGIETMGTAVFSQCTALQAAILPSSLKEIPVQTFAMCTDLASIIIPENVGNIGNSAFFQCTALTSVTCLSTTPPTLDITAFLLVPDDFIIMVPAESVNSYKSDPNWGIYTTKIQAIP